MRKLKLFFACLLMAVLSIGQVWGDSYTITLKSSTGTSDSSSGMTSTTVADYVADGASYVSAVAPSGKVFLAKSDCGIKFGNSSGGGSLTFTLATAVKPTSIVVNASQFGASEGKGIFQGEEFDMTGGGGKYVFNNYTVEYDGNTSVTTISVGAEKRGYVKSITVNYGGSTPPPSCTSEITITKAADPANGTFVLDNSGTVCIDEGNATVNVTATPADHYHLASVTTTGSVGTIGSIAGNTCEITDIDADTEIGVTFAEDTKYVVTWNVNGNEDTKTNVYAGEKPVFPATPAACDATSTTFIGWATAPWTGKLADLSEKTVYTSASAMPDVNEAVTYFAVFAKSNGSASNLFSWEGGTKAELTATEGVTALTADNSDYAAGNAPYRVKWNTDGMYIIISVASQPGKVSAGFKMIGGATTSTVTVQEADATNGTFTDVEVFTISGASNDIVNGETSSSFKSTTRAIKLLYHKGSNVGLGPISIESAVSYEDYMTTCAAPTCTDLEAPTVSVPDGDLKYNSAKLTWDADENAKKYIVKFNGEDHETTNAYYEATGLTASTNYAYQVKKVAKDDQSDWCDSEFSTEAVLTTKPAPTAHLTLIDIEGTHASSGDYAVGTPFDLPTTAASCSKTFVGWDPDDECATAPAYAKGAEFTFDDENDVTLYAVYGNEVTPGAVSYNKVTSTAAITDGDYLFVYETGNLAFNGNLSTLDAENNTIGVTINEGVIASSDNVDAAIFTFDVANGTVTAHSGDCIGASSYGNGLKQGAAATYKVHTFSIDGSGNALVSIYDATWNNGEEGTITMKYNAASNQARFRYYKSGQQDIQLYKKTVGEGVYGNYSTTCAAPLDDPTFALNPEVTPIDGKYHEAIHVTISATDGATIHYTTDGSDPNGDSPEYTSAITVDACGSTTIKAIAISTTSQSAVVSATYVIQLPIPSVNAEEPYTEAEAVDVYNSGCYNNEDVWVTGTVQTAQFYDSKTYTITLTNGFKFYKFYDLNGELFTEDYIEAGDILVAKGKLSKYNTTYQLAEGCYLVSRTPAPTKEHINNDQEHPYTIEQAIFFIDHATAYYLSDEVYVQGTVKADATLSSYGNYDVIVTDGNENDPEFKFYRMQKSATETFDADEDITALDVLVVKGTLTKYGDIYELAAGCYMISHTNYIAPVVPVESITLAEGQDAVTIKEGKFIQLEATVNPTTASNKNLTWESSDATIASVDENGKVTAEAIGNATITVKSVADPTISATCEVTVVDATARTTGNAVFQKVTTTTDITDGEYLIVYAEADKDSVAFDGALETLDAAFNTIDVIVDGNFIVAPEDASFTIDVTNGTIKAYSGDYIGVTSYSNGLKQDEDASTYPAHSFTIDENEYAIISLNNSWTNPMILNYNSGVNDQRFRYYKNGSQKKIQLFKKVEATEIRTGLYDGKWGTICPAQKVMLPTGASFYTLTYMEMQGDMPYKLFFDEIETDYLEGGKPYLFIAEGETIKGVRGANAAEAQNYNGFYGNISGSTIHIETEQNAYIAGNDVINYYGLTNNTFTLLPTGTTVQHERAVVQVKNGALNCPEPVLPAPARPGARRVVAGNNAPAVATGCDEINASETPVKMMINGQLFIILGEKMYDATGRLVK